ncbi:MAG: amidase family protein, partial [Pseudomonadota bacterium]
MTSVWPSIRELARRVRGGECSAIDTVSQSLQRIQQYNDEIGAFTRVLNDRALRQARAIDGLIAEGKDPGTLAGVPFAVKDLIDVEGLT